MAVPPAAAPPETPQKLNQIPLDDLLRQFEEATPALREMCSTSSPAVLSVAAVKFWLANTLKVPESMRAAPGETPRGVEPRKLLLETARSAIEAAQEVIGQCDCIMASDGQDDPKKAWRKARETYRDQLDIYDYKDLSRCPACGDVWENAAPRWHACSAADRLVAVAAPEMTDAELLLRVRGVMVADPFGRAVLLPEIVYSRRASAPPTAAPTQEER